MSNRCTLDGVILSSRSLRLAVVSDIYSEFHKDPQWLPPIPPDIDLLILVGDIGLGTQALETIQCIAKYNPRTKIAWVAGNHEFYGNNIDLLRNTFRDAFIEHEQITYLDNSHVTINGWTILGSTLWSGFDWLGTELRSHVMKTVQSSISDFHVIRKGSNNEKFTPTDALEFCKESRDRLEQHLSECNKDKTIVATHFPPSVKLKHPSFPIDELTAYFIACCDDLIENHSPKYWVYGHNHWSDSIQIKSTTLIINQLSYPNEKGVIPPYNKQFIIELKYR